LKSEGYMISVFTTRPFTPKMKQFLDSNNVPYDSVNSNKHNPPNTSMKPMFHCFVDDRVVRCKPNHDKEELYQEIRSIVDWDF
jgi:hypothetical protein